MYWDLKRTTHLQNGLDYLLPFQTDFMLFTSPPPFQTGTRHKPRVYPMRLLRNLVLFGNFKSRSGMGAVWTTCSTCVYIRTIQTISAEARYLLDIARMPWTSSNFTLLGSEQFATTIQSNLDNRISTSPCVLQISLCAGQSGSSSRVFEPKDQKPSPSSTVRYV